jgi:hypothetical protein
VRRHIERAMIVKSSRIRFLESWARKLPTRNREEVEHAVQVFAEARWGTSKATACKYAREVLELLGFEEQDELKEQKHTPQLIRYLAKEE